jgi:DNA-binding NarL/FixJ family response regulator
VRVVIADDSVLLREGLSRLLAEAGIETVAAIGDGEALEVAVAAHHPDLALVDIRMPPTYTHEGAQAATRLRKEWPEMGILLLSQSIESRHALELARQHPSSFGYLLKDRVLDVPRSSMR